MARPTLVYPGSFSPVTNAHINLCLKTVCDALNPNEVIISPVNSRYKKFGLMPDDIRVELLMNHLKALEDELPNVYIDEYEINQLAAVRTLDYLQHLEICGVREITLLLGADCVLTMATPGVWVPFQVKELLSRFKIAVLERPDQNVTKERILDAFANCEWTKAGLDSLIFIDVDKDSLKKLGWISSSEVRCRAEKGEDFSEMVEASNIDLIRDYCEKRKIYSINE